jgi:hypothetical protein
MHNYFYQETVWLGQYWGSYDHSAYTQYTRKEFFPGGKVPIPAVSFSLPL